MQKRLVHDKSNLFTSIISSKKLTFIAKSVGFLKLKPKKITAVNIILSYMNFISGANFSFSNWSISLSNLINKKVSKQAIFKRINKNFIPYIKAVLEEILVKQLKNNSTRNCNLFKHFGNVYLQDATHFSLAAHLVSLFPGNRTCGAQRAVAKIVTIFNLKKGCFTKFDLSYFTKPDSTFTDLIYGVLEKSDLIIRDLGYFMISDFEKIKLHNAFFLSRMKLNVAVYDVKTNEQMNLAQILKKKKRFDANVLISNKNPIKVRLVALPLPKKAVQERIRKAKADRRNTRTNHSKEYYYLLGYSIFITNVGQEIWEANDICDAYKTRWHIEILFKSWKSNLKAQYTEPDRYATETSVKTHFFLLLIYVSAFIMPLLIMIEQMIHKNKLKMEISILKLTSYVALNLNEILSSNLTNKTLVTIAYQIKYDKRTDRNNFVEFMYS